MGNIPRHKAFSIPHGFAEQLNERLEQLEGRAEETRAILKEIDEERDLVGKLLELEMRRAGKTGSGPGTGRKPEIRELIDAALLGGITTKEALKESAEENGHTAPARAIHAILMNYFRHGYVTRGSGERYGLTEKGNEALSGKAEGSQ
jgi:hypothetical protein